MILDAGRGKIERLSLSILVFVCLFIYLFVCISLLLFFVGLLARVFVSTQERHE